LQRHSNEATLKEAKVGQDRIYLSCFQKLTTAANMLPVLIFGGLLLLLPLSPLLILLGVIR